MNKNEINKLFDLFLNEYKEEEETPPCVCCHEFIRDEGILICRLCSVIDRGVFDIQTETNEPTYCAYKRVTHIKSTLTRYLGRESFILPEDIVSLVQKFNPYTIEQVRHILKMNGLAKYYIHAYAIGHRVGIALPKLTHNEYEKVIFYFTSFNSVYSKKYHDKNMINYHFILYKIFQLIGRDELISGLKMGRNKIKLANYETIWKECFI